MAIKLTVKRREEYMSKLDKYLVIEPSRDEIQTRINAFVKKNLPSKILAVLDDPLLEDSISWMSVYAFPKADYGERFNMNLPESKNKKAGYIPFNHAEWRAIGALHVKRQECIAERKAVRVAVAEVLASSATFEEAIGKLPTLATLVEGAERKEMLSLTAADTLAKKFITKNAPKHVVSKVKDPEPEIKKVVKKSVAKAVAKAIKAKTTKK